MTSSRCLSTLLMTATFATGCYNPDYGAVEDEHLDAIEDPDAGVDADGDDDGNDDLPAEPEPEPEPEPTPPNEDPAVDATSLELAAGVWRLDLASGVGDSCTLPGAIAENDIVPPSVMLLLEPSQGAVRLFDREGRETECDIVDDTLRCVLPPATNAAWVWYEIEVELALEKSGADAPVRATGVASIRLECEGSSCEDLEHEGFELPCMASVAASALHRPGQALTEGPCDAAQGTVHGGPPAFIRFHNASDEPRGVARIDAENVWLPAFELAPGASRLIATHVGEAFGVEATGTCTGRFMVGTDYALAEID